MKFLKSNPFNSIVFILMLMALAFNCFEAFDNTLYNNWPRQHIHLFIPVIPAVLLIIGIFRKEYYILIIINLVLIGIHYFFIMILNDIGEAGAGVIKLL